MKNKVKIIVCILLVSILVCSCGMNKDVSEVHFESSKIVDICKLATVECYYHNVARIEKSKDADHEILDFLKRDRKMWIEYTGVAKIGIDASNVSITVEQNTVEITIPNAEIIDIYVDKDSYNKDSYIADEDDWLVKNPITSDMESEAIELAQETMKAMVLENDAVFESAIERAKKLIKNYVDQIGIATGKTYTIKWIEIEVNKNESIAETTVEETTTE